VDAAVALVDREGLEALTMPRLAEDLGVDTMSLYRHIAGKDDLLDAIAAQLVAGVEVPGGDPDDWEGRVVGYVRSLRAQALRHPALVRLLADRGLTGGPIFEQLEAVLSVLRTAGFSELEAVRALYSLITYVLGYLIWELPRVHLQPPAAYRAAWNSGSALKDPFRRIATPGLSDPRPGPDTMAAAVGYTGWASRYMHEFSVTREDFGLVAITRKRVKQSLERTLSTQCAICAGTGMVKSPTTVCNEIYIEMRKMQNHLERQDVLLRVHPEVVKTLKVGNARWLNELEEMSGKTIIVKSDPALHPEQFDIH